MAAQMLHHHLAPLELCSRRRLKFWLLQHLGGAQPSQQPQSQVLPAGDLRRQNCLPPKSPGPPPSLPSLLPPSSPVPLLSQAPPRQAACSSHALCQRLSKAAQAWVQARSQDLLCGWTCSRHRTLLQRSSRSNRVPAHRPVIPIGQQVLRVPHCHRMGRAIDCLCSSRRESRPGLPAISSNGTAIRFLMSSPHHKEHARSISILLTAEGFACLLLGLYT